MCHMSGVRCQVSHVTFFLGQSGGASPSRICYQRGLPRLVLGQTPHFLGEKLNTRTNTIHYQNAGSVAVILNLRVGVQQKPNNDAITLSTRGQ